MSKIRRIIDIKTLELIEPHLIFRDKELKNPFLVDLIERMTRFPESTLVLGAFDEKDLLGFTVSFNPGIQLPYITLAQAWCTPGCPSDQGKELLRRNILWALGLGKSYIRAETLRDEFNAILRRYGFEPYSAIVKLEINESLLERRS